MNTELENKLSKAIVSFNLRGASFTYGAAFYNLMKNRMLDDEEIDAFRGIADEVATAQLGANSEAVQELRDSAILEILDIAVVNDIITSIVEGEE